MCNVASLNVMYSLSLLLRYLNRVARHPTLREDPDFRQFLEADVVLNDSLFDLLCFLA